MRIFKGVEYGNCDHYTDSEIAVIANWSNAPEREKQVIREKSNWRDTNLFQIDSA